MGVVVEYFFIFFCIIECMCVCIIGLTKKKEKKYYNIPLVYDLSYNQSYSLVYWLDISTYRQCRNSCNYTIIILYY